MAFSSTEIRRFVRGDRNVVIGSFTNTGTTTGGTITTGLRRIEWAEVVHTGSVTTQKTPHVNATFPHESGDIEIVTAEGADGIWRFEGI